MNTLNPFPSGARVVFIGDSITAGCNYCTRIAAYYVRHLPNPGVIFKNAGVSGGTVQSSLLYYDASVAPFQPTYAMIMLGVNDSDRDALTLTDEQKKTERLDAAFTRYVIGVNDLLDKLRHDGVSVILCTPAPYAEYMASEQAQLPGGYALIRRYAEAVRTLAAERGLPLIDFHACLSEYYLCEPLYNPDHVHPNDAGHYRMASCALSAMGLTPDPYRPITEELSDSPALAEWNALAFKVCYLYTAEWIVIRNFTLPTEDKLSLVKKTIDDGMWESMPFFQNITAAYLENKVKEGAMLERMNTLWTEIYPSAV